MDNYILAYYQGIRDGSICVGRWIRLLYEKLVTGIDDGTYIFDQRKADNVIRFFEKFVRHNKGPLAPGPLVLSLWQKALLSAVYGIVDENGIRVFKEVFVVVGRKNGKTLVASGIIDHGAYLGDYGAEIYCVAPKLDQADLVYSAFEFTMNQNPEFSRRTQKRKSDYYIKATNATVKKISFNEKRADGYSPSVACLDELSSWPAARGLKMYEVLMSGTVAREQPIMFGISSAGYVDDGIYDELFRRGTRFLLGESRERHLLPVLYTIDDVDKWDDINELRKSLPGLGVSIKIQTILDEIDIAHESLSKKREFLTKYCNVKQNSSAAYIDAALVARATGPHISPDDLRESYAVGGVDLSQTRDLCAACLLVEKDGEIYLLAKAWLPRERLQDAIQKDGLPYDLYIQRGLLGLSGDNVIDYNDVYEWFVEMVEEYHIYPLQVGYDRYSSTYYTQQMSAYGFHMDSVYQGDNLWPMLEQLLGALEDGRFHIGDNDLVKVHMLNAAVKMSVERGRGKLVKMSPYAHVDLVASILDALAVRDKWSAEIGDQLRND